MHLSLLPQHTESDPCRSESDPLLRRVESTRALSGPPPPPHMHPQTLRSDQTEEGEGFELLAEV